MHTFFTNKAREIQKNKELIEKELNTKLEIIGRKITFSEDPIKEYETELVLDAIDFGFPIKTALLLKNEDVSFVKLNIRDLSRKRNLEVVKGRVIGTHGKTKDTLETIADCKIKVKENEVGIIGNSTEVQIAVTALTSLIKGSKQANVYRFLEKNKKRK